MNNEFESLTLIVREINVHRQKGSITASEMECVESRIPEVISLTPNGLFALHIPPTPETTEIQPEVYVEPVEVTQFEPETISDSQNGPPPPREKAIPPNRSLNGRHLEIIPREQNLLAAIRRGATQTEILNTIYSHIPLQKAISQMLNDTQHIRDLLQLNGCNLLMHSGPDGYSFEEVINEPKPTSNLSFSTFRGKKPVTKEAPITKQPAPPEPSMPRPHEGGGLNENNLLPTEVVAYNAIRNSFPESPLGAGKWLSAINAEREKIGARPLGSYDLEGLISSIKEATGISIIKVTHHNKDFYYRERRRGRKPS